MTNRRCGLVAIGDVGEKLFGGECIREVGFYLWYGRVRPRTHWFPMPFQRAMGLMVLGFNLLADLEGLFGTQ